MSDEKTKELHSKRIHQKHNYVVKQTKIARSYNIPVKEGEEHRLQDHAAVNCGIPNCILCANPRKIWKEKTKKEKSFDQTTKWTEQ